MASLLEMYQAKLDEKRAWRAALFTEITDRQLQLAALDVEIAEMLNHASVAAGMASVGQVQGDVALAVMLAGGDSQAAIKSADTAAAIPLQTAPTAQVVP